MTYRDELVRIVDIRKKKQKQTYGRPRNLFVQMLALFACRTSHLLHLKLTASYIKLLIAYLHHSLSRDPMVKMSES